VDRGVDNHAHGAFDAAMHCGTPKIDAIGIDAPLFWNAAGDRIADQLVRKAATRLGCSGGTVNAVNSLRGACLIQGMLIAMICRQRIARGILITEAHPKALLWLVGKATRRHSPTSISLSDLSEYVVGNRVEGANDHERDATLGAIAAFAMKTRLIGWQDLYALEPNSITPLEHFLFYCRPFRASLNQA
jgi:predicted nuclease with RNAse H fold